MKYRILFFFIVLFVVGCNQQQNQKYNNSELNSDVIKADTQKRLLDINYINVEQKDSVTKKHGDTSRSKKSVPKPTILSQFSETEIYYKNYIGKAYLERDFNKYFKTNRNYLDSLIKNSLTP